MGDNLIDRLQQDPVPGKIGFAKWKLLDRYARLYFKTSDEHRPEPTMASTTVFMKPCSGSGKSSRT
jgi:hypothetical protein